MGCHDVEQALSALLDGELDAGTAAAVQAHLDGCPSCRGKRLVLEATRRLVGSLEAEEVSPDFDARLARRLREAHPAGGLRRAVGLWASLAAAAVLVGALGLLRRSPKEPVETPRIAERHRSGVRETPATTPEAPQMLPSLQPERSKPRPRAAGSHTARPLQAAPSIDPAVDDTAAPEPEDPSRRSGLPHAEPIRIALAGPEDEAWRGGRSADLLALEERVAAEARRALSVSEIRREE